MRERIAALGRLLPADEAGRGTHLFVLCATLLVVGFLVWAHLGTLDIVALASGEVIPSTQVKSVQHLEGGIVEEILVHDGDRVARDQPLVTLQSTATDAQVQEIQMRLTALRIDIARLEAEEADRAEVSFAAELARMYPNEVAQARTLFSSRRERYRANLSMQEQAIAQREQAINEIAARIRNSRNTLRLLEEQVRISEDLLKDELTNRYNHLALLRDLSALKSRIEEDSAGLRRSELSVKEAKGQIDSIRHSYQQEVKEHLAQARRELDEHTQRLKRFSDSQRRTVVRSPVEGLVKTLHVVTRGGVVAPGGMVADIVPSGDRLIVEAKLPTYDVGYVHLGQRTKIRLASADAVRFGTIDGEVVHVSPDTLTTDKGAAYYRVRIETESDHFESKGLRYQLYPGMQVMANIHTGRRSVLDYLLEPYLGFQDEALHER